MQALAFSKRRFSGVQAAPPLSVSRAPEARLALVGGPRSAPSLREIEDITREFAGDVAVDDASRRARRRALAVTAQVPAGFEAERVALTAFAADMVAAVAPGLAQRPRSLRAMMDRLTEATGLPRCVLGREVLRAPQLLHLPPPLALEVGLALLMSFAQARAAAVWTRAADGGATILAGAGDLGAMPVESHEVAADLISGETIGARAEGDIAGVMIELWQSSPAALLVFGEDVLSPARAALLEAAALLLTVALERRLLTTIASDAGPSAVDRRHSHAIEQDVVTAAERRLARLRFDLHDGPQQDIVMLAGDLRLLRSQLEMPATEERHAHVLGRIDDLEARLVALDGDLRRISVSVQSPFLHRESFECSLRALMASFSRQSGLTPTIQLDGDFTSLTDSQHITLLGLIREALSNVREHSKAAHVGVRVSCTDGGAVTASVADDGRGFDLEATLVRAARKGRLGLIGMHERVRLLGGSTTITSSPGGPTVVEATLPPPPVGAPRRNDR
jgi:signal transduction histidine kinase